MLPVRSTADLDLFMKKWLVPDSHTIGLVKEVLVNIVEAMCLQKQATVYEIDCHVCPSNQPIKSKLVRHYYEGKVKTYQIKN